MRIVTVAEPDVQFPGPQLLWSTNVSVTTASNPLLNVHPGVVTVRVTTPP